MPEDIAVASLGFNPVEIQKRFRAGLERKSAKGFHPPRRDTAQAMSQENVEAFKRGAEAYNRQDVDALLKELDPEVEWHSALLIPFGGEATVS